MTIKQFIEKAIEGGYLGGKSFAVYRPKSRLVLYEEEDCVEPKLTKTISEVMLDPKLWQAVGKVERWEQQSYRPDGLRVFSDHEADADVTQEGWLANMHRMIDCLAEGKSLEDFIATL